MTQLSNKVMEIEKQLEQLKALYSEMAAIISLDGNGHEPVQKHEPSYNGTLEPRYVSAECLNCRGF
jgi:hypothetical protein